MTTNQTPWTVDEIGGERARSMLQIVLTELGITPDWRGEQAELQVQSALWQLQKRAEKAESALAADNAATYWDVAGLRESVDHWSERAERAERTKRQHVRTLADVVEAAGWNRDMRQTLAEYVGFLRERAEKAEGVEWCLCTEVEHVRNEGCRTDISDQHRAEKAQQAREKGTQIVRTPGGDQGERKAKVDTHNLRTNSADARTGVSDVSEFATLTDLTDDEHAEFARNAMSSRGASMTSFQRRVAEAVQAAMSSTTLKIDGNALARAVNTHNRRTDRR